MAEQREACSIAGVVQPCRSTVQWNEPLDVVLAHLDASSDDEVFVLEGDRLVGRIARPDIERSRREGNWLGCVSAMDAMSRDFVRCVTAMTLDEARTAMASAGVAKLPAVDTQGRFIGTVAASDAERTQDEDGRHDALANAAPTRPGPV